MMIICRTVIQENIDVIRLQREVKEKSTKLTAIQAQFSSLDEVQLPFSSNRPFSC